MKRTWLYLTETEWRLIVYSLNALKSKMIRQGQYTDAIDDALLKIIKAPIKKVQMG